MFDTIAESPPAQALRPVVQGGVALALLAASTITYAAGFPWLLPLAVTVLVFATCAIWVSWALALAAATIVPLAILAGSMVLFPLLDIGIFPGVTATMIVTGVAAIVIALAGRGWRLPSRSARTLGLASLAVPAAVAAIAATLGRSTVGGGSWTLWNDGIYHLFATQALIDDGGLPLGGSRDPLVNELFAIFALPGRSGVDGSNLLAFDAARQAGAVLLVLLWMSILFSVLVARAVPASHPGVRSAIAILAGLLPWTWFVSGFTLRFGYHNAIVGMVILLACVLIWIDSEVLPTWSSALHMLTATVLLADWAVLAIVPILWGTWLIIRERHAHLALRGWAAVAWIACFLGSGAYALFITLPSVSQNGEVGLTANGGFFGFSAIQAGLILAALLVVAWMTARTRPSWNGLRGVLVFTAASLIGVALLLAQRTGPGIELWGYYPQKFSWILAVVAVAMIARMVALGVTHDLRRRMDCIAAPLVVVVAALAVMAAAPPMASPLVAHGAWGLQRLIPVTTIVGDAHGDLNADLSYLSRFTPTLYAAAASGDKVLLSHFVADDAAEQWINEVLVAVPTADDTAPSRRDFETLDMKKVSDLCDALAIRGPGTTVWTRDRGLEDRVESACPGTAFSVKLRS